ncbi:MAG: helix-turn-helix domain-containing protein [Pseudomonadales bacterium]
MNTAVLETTQPDELSERFTGDFLPEIEVDTLRPGRFRARVNVPVDAYESPVSMMITSMRNVHLNRHPAGYTYVNVPLRGAFESDQGQFVADVIPRSADVTNRDRSLNLRSQATSTLVIRLDDRLLLKAGQELTGGGHQPNLNFDGTLNLRGSAGRAFLLRSNTWWSAIHSDTQDSTTQEIELASDFLLATELAGVSALGESDNLPNPGALQKAEDWIFNRLAEPITRSELCEASGLHVRTLTRGFQTRHGVSPMQFVRDLRLDAIRSVLLCSNAKEATVTAVAEDFGMSHLGRFAQDYQLRFHEKPVDTLKR